jgi:hypothetical protein
MLLSSLYAPATLCSSKTTTHKPAAVASTRPTYYCKPAVYCCARPPRSAQYPAATLVSSGTFQSTHSVSYRNRVGSSSSSSSAPRRIVPVMVEGHQCHRVGHAHRRLLLGKAFEATSPNGRFVEGRQWRLCCGSWALLATASRKALWSLIRLFLYCHGSG